MPKQQSLKDFLLSYVFLKPDIDAALERINNHSAGALNQVILRELLGVRRQSMEVVFAVMKAD